MDRNNRADALRSIDSGLEKLRHPKCNLVINGTPVGSASVRIKASGEEVHRGRLSDSEMAEALAGLFAEEGFNVYRIVDGFTVELTLDEQRPE